MIYGVITVVRQIVEPKLVASQLGLPAFVTLMAMYYRFAAVRICRTVPASDDGYAP